MRQEQRLAAILGKLADTGSVTVTGLADDLGTSVASIRRDLQALEEQKLLKRTHGGAVAVEVIYELPLRYRVGRREEKRQIAEAAAQLLTESVHSVGFNGGTTTTELARLLATTRSLKVVTNALNIASDLCSRPTVDLVVTGGGVRPESYELVGPIADRALAGISLDLVFLGVDGIDARGGITTHDEVEAQTDNCLLRTAHRVVVLADGSKVGKRAFSRIAAISEVHMVITDSSAPSDELDRLRAAGVEVVVA
ncbi:DeoR/GlpR family DNA-binding transcription regulator [Lentzea nigeriaca]|uniref:DeoR/GlpR family DNA-binding transcription regulator n=1 Tax=Lentzea nigeriaca TaxID=1128665 RepID=UPI00195DBAC4|nr:DeoR/GlpR family DNA-binding transcription regulator [Lentzea nigeriaca]MBM7858428.1 DeoR family transcriptional regulator of aga operon [Lentzea nigeriaca]